MQPSVLQDGVIWRPWCSKYTFDDCRRSECAHKMHCACDAEERDEGSNTETSGHVLLNGHVFCQYHRCNGYIVESGEHAYRILVASLFPYLSSAGHIQALETKRLTICSIYR